MMLTDARGLPLSVLVASASFGETTLLEPLLDQRVTDRSPKRIIYDRALDSDEHRRRMRKRHIELICPHRSNRVRETVQDGRSLRRYCRRWKMERSNSWLHNFRRIATRFDWYCEIFTGFVQLACLLIVLKRF